MRDAEGEALQRDAGFQTGQGCSDAEVDTAAEREVRLLLASVDLKRIAVLVDGGVVFTLTPWV